MHLSSMNISAKYICILTLVGREDVPSSTETLLEASVNPILPLMASSGMGINSLSLGPIEGLEGGSTSRVGKVSVRTILTESTVA